MGVHFNREDTNLGVLNEEKGDGVGFDVLEVDDFEESEL